MVIPLGELSLLLASFLTPFASALSPLALPLPGSFTPTGYVVERLASAPFSSDVTQSGRVKAEQDRAALHAFINNNQPCFRPNEDLSYQVVLRNFSNTT